MKRREKKSRFRLWLIALAAVGVVGAVVAGAMVFLEGSAPGIVFESPALHVGKTAPYNGTIHEQGRGLRRIWIGLLQGGKEVVLVDIFNSGALMTGFITDDQGDIISVFVPTGPNPTSGNIYHLQKERVTRTTAAVDVGMKTIISCGAGSAEVFAKMTIK